MTRSLLALALFGLLFVGAGAASPVTSPAASNARDVYRRPLGHDPATLDPARVKDIYSLSVSQQIFDGLVQFDQTLTPVPGLAQFWKASRDGLTWTFALRKGVRFHHGREVTADDVVYSFTRLLDPKIRSGAADLLVNISGAAEYRAGRASNVTGMVALDRHTVRVTLTEAQTPFVSVLAVGHAKIVPKEIVEREGEAFGAHPIGTGPFRFMRWDRGREIVLEANPDHYEGTPRLARVVFRIFAGNQSDAMYDEFEKGDLEDSPVPTRSYREIVASPRFIHVKRPMLSIRFYGLNTRVKPLDDRLVRQALNYAVNQELLVQNVYLGRYTPANGILPPGTLGFNPKLRGQAYDPELAREMLRKAGYPGGRGLPPLTIWSSVKRDEIVRQHEEVVRAFRAVGVTADLRYLTDWPAFSKMLDEGKLPVFLYGWYADVPDPDNFLAKLFHSKSPRNFFGYANPVVDELLVAARNERDMPRRVELYRRVEQIVVDDAIVIPILHHTYERLFQPWVRSVEVSGLGDPYIPLRKIWLERPPR